MKVYITLKQTEMVLKILADSQTSGYPHLLNTCYLSFNTTFLARCLPELSKPKLHAIISTNIYVKGMQLLVFSELTLLLVALNYKCLYW